MSATRLLVLGAVRMHRTAHGYLVNSELDAIGAQDWAKLKSGSIYHALRQLTKDGLLRATQIEEWPGRVDHEITEEGEKEFARLLRDAIRRPDPRPDLFASGLSFLSELTRTEALELLDDRLRALEEEREEVAARIAAAGDSEQLAELFDMLKESADHNVEWTRGLIRRLESGAHRMAGEDPQ